MVNCMLSVFCLNCKRKRVKVTDLNKQQQKSRSKYAPRVGTISFQERVLIAYGNDFRDRRDSLDP